MSLQVRCDQCNKTLSIPDGAAGKKVRCPACTHIFVASAAESNVPILVEPLPLPAPPPAAPEFGIAPGVPPRVDERVSPGEANEPPRRRRRREPADVLSFQVTVVDPDKEIKGSYKGTLTEDGLTLKKGKEPEIFFPVETDAKYEGGNTLAVQWDGRALKLKVAQFGWYVQRLAKDVAGFLKGERGPLRAEYGVPWYLLVLAMLPVGVPIITVGGFIWGGLAGGLIGANLTVAQVDKLPQIARIFIILALSMVGYAILFVAISVYGYGRLL